MEKEMNFSCSSCAAVKGSEPWGRREIWKEKKWDEIGTERWMSRKCVCFGLYTCVHMWLSLSTPVCHKIIGAIGFLRQSVSLATVTYPSPPTLVILRRKSTELRLGGFHLRMSSHLPGLYLCGESQTPTKLQCGRHFGIKIHEMYLQRRGGPMWSKFMCA